jgi:hypothetical protein
MKMKKNKHERFFAFVLMLFVVGSLVIAPRADALINIVSTYIDMLGNNIYNVGSLNATGSINTSSIMYPSDVIATNWVNASSFSGTHYGSGANLANINTYNSTYDADSREFPFTYYNYTSNDTVAAAATYVEVMKLPLSNGKKVMIECMLFQWANATATAVRYRTTFTNAAAQLMTLEYYSAATTETVCMSNAAQFACDGTASAGIQISPTRIRAYSSQSGDGFFTVEMRNELAGGVINSANVTKGSWCRSIEQ